MELLPFDINILYFGIVLIILLLCSFIVSGRETALFSLSASQQHSIYELNNRSSKAVETLLNDPNRLISTILIVNNLVNIAAILCAGAIIDISFKFTSVTLDFIVKIGVVTFTLLIFGEIMPKTLATYKNAGFARKIAPTIVIFSWIVWPISWILIKLGAKLTPTIQQSHESVSIEQLHTALEVTKNKENENDNKILTGIVTFVGREVVEIMRPRVDIQHVEAEWSFSEVLDVIKNSNYSRMPVYGEDIDDVRGILFVKDLLPYIDANNNFEWTKLIREPYFVPENKKINELLEDFQAKRRHQAIVVDEYGGTLGLVTLEDILEEIVGEISDETDTIADSYHQLSPNNYLFDGSTHLVSFVHVTHINEEKIDKHKGDSDTLAGLMMELKGEFFKTGDEIEFEGWKLKVEEVEGYRITKVLVSKNDL